MERRLQPAQHGPYASCYDSTMVRVTPEYFAQLDKLSEAATDAVLDRYRSGHKAIGILELGYGTGALTSRLTRSLTQIVHVLDAHTREPISLSYQGWDCNGFMKDIAESQLRVASAPFPIDMLVRDFGRRSQPAGRARPHRRLLRHPERSARTTTTGRSASWSGSRRCCDQAPAPCS